MAALSRPLVARIARAVGVRRKYMSSVPAVQVKKRDGTYTNEYVRRPREK